MSKENIQELIKDIISRELSLEYEYDFSYMSEEENKKHNEYIEKVTELTNLLNLQLDEEGQRILIQLVELKDSISSQEGDYYFERGVRCGLTDLNYLNKYFKCL